MAMVVSIVPLINGFSYLIHGIIGLAKLIIYYIVALALLFELRDYKFAMKLFRVQSVYFIILSTLAILNFLSIGIQDIDFIGDFFDQISIHGYEPKNHLELSFWTRNTSFCGEPNFLAIYSLLHYMFIVSGSRNVLNRAIQVVLVSLLVISTFSRVGLVLLPALLLLNEFSLKPRAIFIYSFIPLILITTLSKVDYISDYSSKIFESITDRDFGGDDQRLDFYSQAIAIWKKNPIGIGISNYGMAAFDNFGDRGEPNPHNGFLTLLVEQGVFGLLAKLILYAYLLWIVLRNKGRNLFVSMVIILSSVAVNNFDKILGYDLFFILIGNERFRLH